MQLTDKMCYSKLLAMQETPGWADAVDKVEYTRPLVEYEGVAGYVETTVTITVRSLPKLTEIMGSWYNLPDTERNRYRRKAMGIECR